MSLFRVFSAVPQYLNTFAGLLLFHNSRFVEFKPFNMIPKIQFNSKNDFQNLKSAFQNRVILFFRIYVFYL